MMVNMDKIRVIHLLQSLRNTVRPDWNICVYQRLCFEVLYNESRKAITVMYPSFIIECSLIVTFIEIWKEYVNDASTNRL